MYICICGCGCKRELNEINVNVVGPRGRKKEGRKGGNPSLIGWIFSFGCPNFSFPHPLRNRAFMLRCVVVSTPTIMPKNPKKEKKKKEALI